MEVHPQSCAVRSDVHEGVPRTTPRDSTHTRPFLYVAGLSRDRFLAHTLLGTIDFLARSRSSTHAGARPGARRSVGRAGVWASAKTRCRSSPAASTRQRRLRPGPGQRGRLCRCPGCNPPRTRYTPRSRPAHHRAICHAPGVLERPPHDLCVHGERVDAGRATAGRFVRSDDRDLSAREPHVPSLGDAPGVSPTSVRAGSRRAYSNSGRR